MKYDVVIVGGGLAGLTAARDLSRSDRSVLLLEARDRLGGRTWYREFAHTGQRIELGGTWIAPGVQTSIAQEIDRYGLRVVQSPTGIEYRSTILGELREGRLPVPPDEEEEYRGALSRLAELSHSVSFGEALDRQSVDQLDVSLEDYLNDLRLPVATQQYISAWLGGFSFGCTASEISLLNLLWWIAGFGNHVWAWDDVPAEKFADGTKSLVDALSGEADVDLSTSTVVRSVSQDTSGVVVETERGDRFSASCAIMATPMNTWADMEFSPGISATKQAVAAAGHAGHANKVWALVENAPRRMVGVGDGAISWLTEEYKIPEGALFVGIGASSHRLDIGNPDCIEAEVRKFAPNARVLASDGHDWNADEFSKGTWAAYRPGQLSRFHSALSEPEGRLLFAGSDVAPVWPGFMCGAIESGANAARTAVQFAQLGQ